MDNRIEEIALRVRAEMEEIAEREKFPDDLCGLCVRASAVLHERLRAVGIKAEFGIAVDRDWDNRECHVFVIVGKRVVDVTATQFGEDDPVAIVPVGSEWYWKPATRLKTVRGLMSHQTRLRWPMSQQAREEEVYGT